MQDVAANPKYLGAELGFLGVLQTWSRQLWFHLHVHYIVPGRRTRVPTACAGSAAQDRRLLPARTGPGAPLPNPSAPGSAQQPPELFGQIPGEVWRQDWVVDIEAVGSGSARPEVPGQLRLSQPPSASQRILADDGQQITFTYKDSKDGQWKPATVPPQEFIRRFLQHVLPRGFQRVRYFGWLSPAAKAKRQRIFALLDWKAPELAAPAPRPVPLCPRCQKPMHLIGRFTRGPP